MNRALFASWWTGLVFACLLLNHAALAAIYDNASQSAYSDGWQNGDNGGSGFGSWSLSTSGGPGGFFIGSSDAGSTSWGLWANSGGVASAIRPFSSVLAAGQVLTLKMDNGYVNSGGTIGWALQTSGGANRFEFLFIGGQTSYVINDSTTGDNTGQGFTTSGLSLAFALTGANTYSFNINGGSAITGTLGSSGDISQLRFFNANAGNGSDHDLYFNDLQVVPETTNLALAIFGGMFALSCGVRHFRRKAREQAA